LGLFIFAIIVRFYRIHYPAQVVFDEVHFGGFASHYIKSTFFFDVHPPLGKLLIAFTGVLIGYDGSFSFEKIAMDYTNVNYVGLRLLPCLLGAALVPMAYATMRNFGYSSTASIVTGLMVLFENALATQSRLILLDSFLVFFTGFTALMWSEFLRWKNEPFSNQWWRTLTMVGVGLGLTVSVKWVGLFTITWVGVSTIIQLWNYITDPTIPVKVFARHFYARAIGLIAIPISIYLASFKLHFAILNKTGPGAAFMPAEFQATLAGTPLVKTFEDIAFGSTIVIRHVNTGGGYLHSHPHNYPSGSKQQQITCYPHKDANSDFLVKHKLVFVNGSIPKEQDLVGFETLTSGSTIRLEHTPTLKRLHSHDTRPGWNDDKEINEVTAYGSDGILGDANDHWIIELVNGKNEAPVKALSSVFRLKHALTGCYLMSRSSKLPEWGFGQQEVTCSSKGRYDLTLWMIESATHPESIRSLSSAS
jgi:dolichyl-phosphate-mannose-protein mannosyltransferase